MRVSLPSFAQWRTGVITVLARFPWNILCAATGAACLIISLHVERNEWLVGQCTRLAMAAALGMPLFFSLRMLRERTRELAHWPIEAAGIPLLAFWIFLQSTHPFDGPGIVIIRWLLLLAALHFFAAVSAYVRGNERIGFWQFNRWLFLRFSLATLYTGVLTIGLELALLSADKLFALKLSRAYGDLWFLMAGLFHPAFFLAGVPRDFTELNADEGYPGGLKGFTQFALAPLVAVYTAILYAYAVKIMVTWSWPHGWVALPVLLLSGIGILAFLLLYPLRERENQKWARWFTVNFPRAMAPLTILLLLAVQVRVTRYGVTEERYLGIVAGVWILLWSLVFVIRKDSGIRWVPSSLTVICLLSAFGPCSAGALSKASQLRIVEKILEANDLLRDGHAQAADHTKELPTKDGENLRSTLSYLVGTHGGETLKRIFGPLRPNTNWAGLNRWAGVSELMTALKVSKTGYPMRSYSRSSRKPISVEGFRRLWHTEQFGGESRRWSPQHYDDVSIGLDFGLLKLATNEEIVPQPVPLENLLKNLPTASSDKISDSDLTVDFLHGIRSFRIVFRSIQVRVTTEGLRLAGYQLYLLER
jgi:hypothetical protein